MFPQEVKPVERLESVFGIIKHVTFANNRLTLSIFIEKKTEGIQTDSFCFDMNDKFERKVIMSQLAGLCWKEGTVNFNDLLEKRVLISWSIISGYYNMYTNLTSIVLLNHLEDFSYEESTK